MIARRQGKWVPPNQPSSRHRSSPPVKAQPAELPGFFAPKARLERHGIVLGPRGNLTAVFNPAAFVATGQDGKQRVFLVARGEEERPGANWKRHSLPYLAVSQDGIHFDLVQEAPLFKATEWYEAAGGVEDPRYADLRLQPYVDPSDGKSFDGALLYTGFDGKTARVCVAFFNHDNVMEFRKAGPIFSDVEVSQNPIVPSNRAWNKSPAVVQYADPQTGTIRNLLYVGEGNSEHGGIMALESDRPFGWKWPKNQSPAIKAQPGMYTQNLVEPAFPPVVAPLPDALAKQTGERNGIYVTMHGDSPPNGYQVGFRIFSLNNPTAPLYESKGPFLRPETPYEIEGQVGKVVFASGSVEFKGRRFIYYGAADKYIGAVSAPARQ